MKKLKLKKKVKVITTLLSFGMLLTVLPSMKLVAEDDGTAASTYKGEVSVGPYIKYEPAADTYYSDEVANDTVFTTLEADGNMPVVMDGETTTNPVVNKNGSYTYDNSVTVDKTITKETKKTADNKDTDVYKLDMSASSLSKIVNYNAGVDYILLLDVSKNMNPENGKDRMDALKKALTKFINQVYDRSSGSRIALVQFSEKSKVLTNSTGNADESALVTVKTGKENLLEIVNGNSANNTSGLVVDSDEKSKEYSNSDQAMFDALKIFQSVSTADDHKDDLNQKYSDRTRVTLLFSAGLPGKGKNTDNDGKDSNYTGWDITARDSAQATMSMATIMKYTRWENKIFSQSENESKVADSHNWSTLQNNYAGLSTIGCGSTVYTIGLNLDPATDPSTLTTYDTLNKFADISYSYQSFSVNFKIETRQAALVNEYLYRVSSHRETGEHYTLNNTNIEETFKNKYNSLPSVSLSGNYSFSVKDLYGTNLYYFYPDAITRDQDNGYFLTAKDENLERLTEIFNKIAQQVGSTYEGLSVRDYIDSAFVPVSVDSNGVIHELAEEDTVGTSADGKYVGTLKKDGTKGWYIEWSDVKLSPESSANKGDAKTFNESIYVKPVDGMIGGNNLYTNTSDSGVYIGKENKFPFPQPTADIPINYTLSSEDQNIYLTNTVNILDMIKILPNGKNNKGVTMVYTVTDSDMKEVGRYTILPGETTGNWNEGLDGKVSPDNDQNYTITCTITTSVEESDHSLTNSHHVHENIDYSVNKDSSAVINVFKPVLTYKDLTAYYGDFKPNNPDALKSTSWQHGSDIAVAGDSNSKYKAPGLTLTYNEPNDVVNSDTVNTKSDYQVGVTVKVGDKDITSLSSFVHEKCNDKETLTDLNNFIVHVNTCSLTITKNGGTEGETYFFTINKKDRNEYTKASITVGSNDNQVVIKELPVGEYTVSEDPDLSWRYEPTYDNASVSLSKDNSSASVTCTNNKKNDKWLNNISSVVKNVYGVVHSNDNANQ